MIAKPVRRRNKKDFCGKSKEDEENEEDNEEGGGGGETDSGGNVFRKSLAKGYRGRGSF